MWTQKEYAISLIRLVLPPSNPTKKVIVSVSTSSFQYFIQNGQGVKERKVNFFREKIFIPDLKEGIAFQIYSTDSSPKQLIKVLPVTFNQLSSCQSRPSMFHTERNQFELVWEVSVFRAGESENNDETDRDYTEFTDSTHVFHKDLLLNSHTLNDSNIRQQTPDYFQRSTSSQSSSNFLSSRNPRNMPCSKEKLRSKDDSYHILKGKRDKPVENPANKHRGGKRKFFSFLSAGLTGFFSQSTN